MAKIPSLITNSLTGEALNYSNSGSGKVEIKQTFEVTQNNNNFTWTIKSKIYIRLNSGYPQGKGERFSGIWQQIGDGINKIIEDIQILSLSGVWINNVQVSNNAYEWYKILEQEKTYECTTGRQGVKLQCGYANGNNNYYFDDYTLIYLTLPAFSGMQYKVNNKYYFAMPWIKVNGEWKRALQYVKVNDEWKKYNSTWKWNPEG